MLKNKEFDVCIMDEAGQITLPASLGKAAAALRWRPPAIAERRLRHRSTRQRCKALLAPALLLVLSCGGWQHARDGWLRWATPRPVPIRRSYVFQHA
jgi:hypothetical protein